MAKRAWLAGLLDGEGSIGITITAIPKRPHRPFALSAQVQLSMTCKETVDEARRVMLDLGVTAIGYSYREKDPTRHLDAHYLRVGRLADIERLGAALAEHSVTKRRQWQAILEFVRLRLAQAGLDENGRIRRGGKIAGRAYSEREIELARVLRGLNARGPAAKKKEEAWLRKLERV